MNTTETVGTTCCTRLHQNSKYKLETGVKLKGQKKCDQKLNLSLFLNIPLDVKQSYILNL